jgi:cytochrome c556
MAKQLEEARMKRTVGNMVFFFTLVLLAGIPGQAVSASAEHPHNSPGTAQVASANPLIEEMMVLDKAYRDIVSAVALGDDESVRKALETVHGAMEKTHAGMHAGTVALPKNANREKEFVEQDRKFHDKLEALEHASHHKNQREMQRITKQLLDGCVQCHQTFRK